MNKFIVVEVSQLDGEYVDDVEFVGSFESQQDAQEFINNEHNISQERAIQRHEYIKEFAETLPKSYRNAGIYKRTVREIEDFIKFNKKHGKDMELLKDYNPPDYIFAKDLRIVEIK